MILKIKRVQTINFIFSYSKLYTKQFSKAEAECVLPTSQQLLVSLNDGAI